MLFAKRNLEILIGMNLQLKLFIEWCECDVKHGDQRFYYPIYQDILFSSWQNKTEICPGCGHVYKDSYWDELTA